LLELVGILAKIGSIAGIGWWIDLALDDSQQRRVRRSLDDWWTKFDEIKWFDFGPEEGAVALRLFDKAFGKRFWSWRRIGSVCLVSGVTLIISSILILVLQMQVTYLPGGGLGLQENETELTPFYMIAISLPLHLLSMMLSLSATRWVTAGVIGLKGFVSFFGMAALLLLSLFLVAFWIPSFSAMKSTVSMLAAGWTWTQVLSDLWTYLLNISDRVSPYELFPMRTIFANASVLVGGSFKFLTLGVVLNAAHMADYFVSSVRIFFLAFFVICLVLRRFVHRPLSNLGFIWLTSGKPVFATLFGAIAAVVVAVHELTKAT
jgi:hypothetical protein